MARDTSLLTWGSASEAYSSTSPVCAGVSRWLTPGTLTTVDDRFFRPEIRLSSASVLFVLHQWLCEAAGGRLRSGDRGLLAGFGPGFSAEMLLLQWN
jgi:hypothetical protein